MRIVSQGAIKIPPSVRSPIRCIAILSAMTSEMKPVKRALGITGKPRRGEICSTGTYKGVTVLTAVTKMGMVAAETVTEELFARYGATIDHVFVVGVAGAYDTSLKVGDLVIPESVTDHRDGITRYPVNLSAQDAVGMIYSSDQLNYDDDFVAILNTRNVSAVDMESGAITAVCERHGCPVTVVRAISDQVDTVAESYDVFHLAKADGSPKYFASLRFIVNRPQRIGYLIAMAVGAKKAIAAATAELLVNIDRLLIRSRQIENAMRASNVENLETFNSARTVQGAGRTDSV